MKKNLLNNACHIKINRDYANKDLDSIGTPQDYGGTNDIHKKSFKTIFPANYEKLNILNLPYFLLYRIPDRIF